jgi:predicted nuclease of predicted toxin-antitoxin system
VKRKKLLDSYALLAYLNKEDGFAVATAQRENAVILTGDPEFKNVEKLVKIDWLTK